MFWKFWKNEKNKKDGEEEIRTGNDPNDPKSYSAMYGTEKGTRISKVDSSKKAKKVTGNDPNDPKSYSAMYGGSGIIRKKRSFWERFLTRKSKPRVDFSNVDISYNSSIDDEIKKSQEDKQIKNPHDLKSHQSGFPSQSQHSAKWDHNEKLDSKRKKHDNGV
jgi:hypothetical protein